MIGFSPTHLLMHCLASSSCLTGAERFSQDMKLMFGYGAPVVLRVCWCVISPAIMFVVFLLVVIQYKDVTYEGYTYPAFAVTSGYVIAMIPVVPLPICVVYGFLSTKGTFYQVG